MKFLSLSSCMHELETWFCESIMFLTCIAPITYWHCWYMCKTPSILTLGMIWLELCCMQEDSIEFLTLVEIDDYNDHFELNYLAIRVHAWYSYKLLLIEVVGWSYGAKELLLMSFFRVSIHACVHETTLLGFCIKSALLPIFLLNMPMEPFACNPIPC